MRINYEVYKPLIGKMVKYLDPYQKFERYGVIKSICRMKLPPIRRGDRVIKYPSMVGFKVKHPVAGMMKAPVAAILAVRWRGKDIPIQEFLSTRGGSPAVGVSQKKRRVKAAPEILSSSTISPDGTNPTTSETPQEQKKEE